MPYTLEPMTAEHRTAAIDIFNHYIEHSFAAYFEQPVPYEFHNRWLEMIGRLPCCVARDEGGRVVGFAFLRPYHPAPTLNRTAEIGYFIHPDHTRRGLGGQMLSHLIELGRRAGVDNLVASISSLNEPSLAFHRTHGFTPCAHFKAVGRKRDRDFDLIWMQRRI